MAPVNVVIVGASYAGLSIAHSVLELPEVKVVLINPATTFFWNIAAPRIVAKAKAFKPEQYLLSIADAFNKYPAENIEFIPGTATAVDVAAKTISVTPNEGDARSVSYDHLVIASGSTTTSTTGEITGFSIPFKQSNRDDVKQLIEAAQQKIATAKEIVIGGAGPIGVELAGELADVVEQSGSAATITLVSATDRVLPMLKSSGSSAASKMLKQKNVKVVTSTRVTGAEASGDAWTVSLDNGDKLSADLYIPTTGVIPNNSFIPEQFLDKEGWVKVDKEMRVESSKNIYAAGDITNNSMRLSFKAAEQASVAANNLKADILGKGERKNFDQGESIMMVVPIGASGGTGLVFGFTPFSFMVKMIKGKDYFISKAASMVAGKA
ncbi:Apoptosis-inducing factor [Penicillium atrosanguineum]|uniref:Apoptosis-inducing factor n=1 Tax=Penicillium atrosanguineum TaxID=1132637 RepID=A0A9W9KY34_9EURO|nr:Apoptosis-inducing factor [Penicillium atrosanguineum]KAJ5146897.1 Apoptosis-inducing factor [Penicillium atrosanguineum]KAJ5331790.1 Apoptosis-inducing factor [Penicillium atrosanguineum]